MCTGRLSGRAAPWRVMKALESCRIREIGLSAADKRLFIAARRPPAPALHYAAPCSASMTRAGLNKL